MKYIRASIVAAGVAGFATTVSGQNIWNSGVTGDWATPGNWNTGTPPNGGGAEGWFGVSTAAANANINADVGTSGSRNGRVIQGYTGSVGLNSTINVNSGTLFMNEGFYVNFAGANNMNSTLNIASGASVDISFGGSGNPGSLVMNLGNTTNTRTATVDVDGTLTLADSLFLNNSTSSDSSSANDSASVTVGSGGTVNVGNDIWMADTTASTATLDIQSGGTVDFGPGANRRLYTGRGNATINVPVGATLADPTHIHMGHRAFGGGTTTLNLTGGTLTGAPALWGEYGTQVITLSGADYDFSGVNLGYGNASSVAEMTQSSGIVSTGGTLELSRNGGAATYNFDAGTLRTNVITENAGGVFNWGDGTLTLVQPNTGAAGSTDVSSPGFSEVKVGTALTVNGSIGTSANSQIDLGGLFINNGVRFDQLAVSGSLTLGGANDALIMTINPYLLRPNVGTATDSGSIPLVTTGSGLSGTFLTGPTFLQDNLGWSEHTGAFTSAALLPVNTYYLEYTANELFLHYNVEGTVPEPGTVGLLALGLLLARMVRKPADLEYA